MLWWRRLSPSDKILLVTALATVVSAAVTAWLAWSSFKVAELASQEVGVEHEIMLFRACVVASRSEAADGDALIELIPKSDGYEYDERLSREQLLTYLRVDVDYLRCEIANVGRLPVTDVAISLAAQFKGQRPFLIIASPITFLSSDQTARTSRKVIWLVNNSSVPVTVYNPNKIRYSSVERKQETKLLQPIGLSDHWILQKNKDTQEILDQTVMSPFHE